MHIRKATNTDHDAIWAILEPIFRAGETYVIDPTCSRDAGLGYWFAGLHTVYVAVADDGGVLGTYFIQPSQIAQGAHVANCGYATAPQARGQGVARAMLAHSQDTARGAGYRAMQFNFVVSSNTRAVTTRQRDGFEIVGTLPQAFDHPTHGYVDAYVMYKPL